MLITIYDRSKCILSEKGVKQCINFTHEDLRFLRYLVFDMPFFRNDNIYSGICYRSTVYDYYSDRLWFTSFALKITIDFQWLVFLLLY
jgi:hypothetical protein